MSFPPGLNFSDRIATDGRRAYFVCQRGHKILRKVFPTQTAAHAFRSNHDREVHSRSAKLIDRRPVLVHDILDEVVQQFSVQVQRGDKDPGTLRNYLTNTRWLKAPFPNTHFEQISQIDLLHYIDARRQASPTGGAVIKKELDFLSRSIVKVRGRGAATWVVPADDIRPKRTPQRSSRSQRFKRGSRTCRRSRAPS